MNWARVRMKKSKNREYRPDHFCHNKEISEENKHHTYYDTIVRDNIFLYMKAKGYSVEMMSALVCVDLERHRYAKNFALVTVYMILKILGVTFKEISTDNTRILNPKILNSEPPSFVRENTVRREVALKLKESSNEDSEESQNSPWL